MVNEFGVKDNLINSICMNTPTSHPKPTKVIETYLEGISTKMTHHDFNSLNNSSNVNTNPKVTLIIFKN